VKDQNMQKDFIGKLSSIRELLKSRFPLLDVQNLDKVMSQLGHYHYNKKKFFIIGESKEIYNFLIENSYNPYTIYRWLLLERLPGDIKFQIREKHVSQKDAVSEAFSRRHETTFSLGASIKETGMSLIRRM